MIACAVLGREKGASKTNCIGSLTGADTGSINPVVTIGLLSHPVGVARGNVRREVVVSHDSCNTCAKSASQSTISPCATHHHWSWFTLLQVCHDIVYPRSIVAIRHALRATGPVGCQEVSDYPVSGKNAFDLDSCLMEAMIATSDSFEGGGDRSIRHSNSPPPSTIVSARLVCPHPRGHDMFPSTSPSVDA